MKANPTLRWVGLNDENAITFTGYPDYLGQRPKWSYYNFKIRYPYFKMIWHKNYAKSERASCFSSRYYEGCYVVTPRIVRAHTEVRVFP